MPYINSKSVLAIILAGGRGERLYPLTRDRSKPAVPFAGKYRLIDVPISNCIHSHIYKMYVMTQFNSESLNNHIFNTYRFDAFSGGFVEILAPEQSRTKEGWYTGTADSVRKNLKHICLENYNDVIVLAGDHLYKMDYTRILAKHRSHDADVTVAVKLINTDKITRLGVLRLGRLDYIKGFCEKPRSHKDLEEYAYSTDESGNPLFLGSMGVYVFKARTLQHILEKRTHEDFGGDILPYIVRHRNYKACGFLYEGFWADLGTINSFYKVNMALAAGELDVRLYDQSFPFFTHPRFLPPSRVYDSQISSSMISDGCIIRNANVDSSIIGIRSMVSNRVKLDGCILMGADFYEPQKFSRNKISLGIDEGTVIRNAIVDKNARIGKRCVITNKKGLAKVHGKGYCIVDGIVVIEQNAIIANDTVI